MTERQLKGVLLSFSLFVFKIFFGFSVLSGYIYIYISSLYLFETWILLHRNFPVNWTTGARHMYLRKRHMRIKDSHTKEKCFPFFHYFLILWYWKHFSLLARLYVWHVIRRVVRLPSAAVYVSSENWQIHMVNLFVLAYSCYKRGDYCQVDKIFFFFVLIRSLICTISTFIVLKCALHIYVYYKFREW